MKRVKTFLAFFFYKNCIQLNIHILKYEAYTEMYYFLQKKWMKRGKTFFIIE